MLPMLLQLFTLRAVEPSPWRSYQNWSAFLLEASLRAYTRKGTEEDCNMYMGICCIQNCTGACTAYLPSGSIRFILFYHVLPFIRTNDLNRERQETLKSDMEAMAAMEEQLENTRRQRRQRIAGLLARVRNFTGQLCSALLAINVAA